MFKNLTIKKDYLLVAGVVLLLIISYEVAIKRTVDAWRLHNRLTRQLAQTADLSYQPGYLERKKRNLDSIVRNFRVDTALMRSNVINTLSREAEKSGVKLSGVPDQDPSFSTAAFIVQQMEFKGDFFALLTLLNKLSHEKELGYIRTVRIRAPKPGVPGTDTRQLTMQLYIEIAR